MAIAAYAKMRNSITAKIRMVHRWAGVLLGIQVVLWIAGGLIMALLPIEEVRGNHLVRERSAAFVPLPSTIRVPDGQYHSLTAIQIAGHRLLKVQSSDGESFFDADTGATISTLNKQQAEQAALFWLLNDNTVKDSQLLEQLPNEARGLTAPLWQVRFVDDINTVLYLNAVSGELQRVRTDTWRLFDFVWMLHIMDYDERSDFNHPLLIAFAGAALLFVMAGFWLLIDNIKRRATRKKAKKLNALA